VQTSPRNIGSGALRSRVVRTQGDGAIASRRAAVGYAILQVPLAPFQHPSLQHCDAAVAAAIRRKTELQQITALTARWAAASYKSFRRFLLSTGSAEAFIGGELERQVRVLEGWIAEMDARGLQRGGINTNWRGLASVFRWLTQSASVTNPLLFMDAPRIGRRNPRFLSQGAAEDLLRFVVNRVSGSDFERLRNATIVTLMLLAGLRRGEVVRLRIGDGNLTDATLQIRMAKGPDGGKDRTAYMPPQLQRIVSAYLTELRRLPPRKHPELLTSMHNRAISAGMVNQLCIAISKESGMHVAPHILRHTYATLLRKYHVHDRIAMELMGHADLRMLLRYSHVEADEPRQAAQRLVLGE
jgi:integrase/recombinase XerC